MEEKGLLASPVSVLAIDPGLSGAVCRLGQGKLELRRDFKLLPDIARGISDLAGGVSHAVMELVHAMPGQGVCSMFSFGRAAGVADGALALSLPALEVEQVTPQKWQNFFRAWLGHRFEVVKGRKKWLEEFDSRATATKIFPSFADYFRRVKDHNSSDSVLIAVWKLQQLQRS